MVPEGPQVTLLGWPLKKPANPCPLASKPAPGWGVRSPFSSPLCGSVTVPALQGGGLVVAPISVSMPHRWAAWGRAVPRWMGTAASFSTPSSRSSTESGSARPPTRWPVSPLPPLSMCWVSCPSLVGWDGPGVGNANPTPCWKGWSKPSSVTLLPARYQSPRCHQRLRAPAAAGSQHLLGARL